MKKLFVAFVLMLSATFARESAAGVCQGEFEIGRASWWGRV